MYTWQTCRLFVPFIFPIVLHCGNYWKLKINSYLVETGQAAESSIMNPVLDEERYESASKSDSSGQQVERSKDILLQ